MDRELYARLECAITRRHIRYLYLADLHQSREAVDQELYARHTHGAPSHAALYARLECAITRRHTSLLSRPPAAPRGTSPGEWGGRLEPVGAFSESLDPLSGQNTPVQGEERREGQGRSNMTLQ